VVTAGRHLDESAFEDPIAGCARGIGSARRTSGSAAPTRSWPRRSSSTIPPGCWGRWTSRRNPASVD